MEIGPKYQDRADIKARAQAARAKARHGEAKESKFFIAAEFLG